MSKTLSLPKITNIIHNYHCLGGDVSPQDRIDAFVLRVKARVAKDGIIGFRRSVLGQLIDQELAYAGQGHTIETLFSNNVKWISIGPDLIFIGEVR